MDLVLLSSRLKYKRYYKYTINWILLLIKWFSYWLSNWKITWIMWKCII